MATHLKARGGDRRILIEPTASSLTNKRMRSSMALQVNSMGRVDIQVKMTGVEQDCQSLVLGLRYGRHRTNFNHATACMVEDVVSRLRAARDPLRQEASANPKGHGGHTKATAGLFRKPTTPNRTGARCDIPTPSQSPVSR